MKHSHSQALAEGAHDGLPIMLGYLAVGFSLGIAARSAHMTAFQGFLASFLNNASAGEYAAFTMIASDATYAEVALITLIANARYLLMSCALSQKFSPDTKFFHRLLVGYDVTDEIFGVTIPGRESSIPSIRTGSCWLPCPDGRSARWPASWREAFCRNGF